MATFTETTTYVIHDCFNCGMLFAVTEQFDKARLADHQNFYCPNGHSQHYVGKTEAQELREQLATAERNEKWYKDQARRAEQDARHFEKSRNAYKGRVTHLKNRAAEGICPCCNEKFPNLHEHMKSNHPEFLEIEEPAVEVPTTEPKAETGTPVTQTAFTCEKCGKSYTFQKSFKKHQRDCKGRKKAERVG